MNVFQPVSSIMSTRLITVSPNDNLKTVEQAFKDNHIHHLPVTVLGKLVGMVSKQDFVHFTGAMYRFGPVSSLNESRLEHAHVEEIMIKGVPLPERLYVPEAFNENSKAEAAQRLFVHRRL